MKIPAVQSFPGAMAYDPAQSAQVAATDPAVTARSAAVHQAVRDLNQAQVFGEKNELRFILDSSNRRPLLRVVNRETNEVVMQIPPEYALRLADQHRNHL